MPDKGVEVRILSSVLVNHGTYVDFDVEPFFLRSPDSGFWDRMGTSLETRCISVAGSSRYPQRIIRTMASLEKRNGTYRIVFRCGGQKYGRSLKTESVRTAELSLAQLEDSLRRAELGTLAVPPTVAHTN